MSKVEEKINLDMEEIMSDDVKPIAKPKRVVVKDNDESAEVALNRSGKELINCLRQSRIIVRLVPKETWLVKNPKHVLAGGMSEQSVRYYTVPVLSSGVFKNVLTNAEKDYLEYIMGLQANALSVYKSENNFWSNYMVRLTKQDTILDLSVPEDYIKYKVLLANTSTIAPSLEVLRDMPKATYQYVLIEEGAEERMAVKKVDVALECFELYGAIKSDHDKLRIIVEILDGRQTAQNVKMDYLQNRIYELINRDPKMFLGVIKDPMLDTKVLIKKAVERGHIIKRGNYYYLKDGNLPLCGVNEEPTFSVACRFLNLPKNSEMLLSLQAKTKD